MTVATTRCPDDNQIVAFTAGHVRGADAAAIEGHIDECPDCRLVLTHLAHSSAVERTWADSACDAATATTCPGDEYAVGHVLADRFCLLRRVGAGGMGQVYEAEDTLLGIRVAIKLLPPQGGAAPATVAHLHQEILLGRRVSHPNVCRIHDLGTCGDLHFLTMQLVDGDTLAELLARGRMPAQRGRRIAEQIVAALAAAHREGVVHRDLKPANIMVGRRDHVTVMDFGLARDDRREAGGWQGRVGTPGYWAPEQARGETATPASDVYALGMVLLEVLSGPRDGRGEPSALAGVPRPLRAIVERCLATRPGDRFASAVDVEARLQRVARTRRRRRAHLLSMTPAGLGIGSALLALFMMAGRSAPAPDSRDSPTARPQAARRSERPPVAPRPPADFTECKSCGRPRPEPSGRR